MKSEEITTLAREYAEWVLSVPGAEKLPNCLRNEATGTLREDAEEVLKWLSTRYCLVEKERVKDEYHEAKFTCGNVDPCSDTFVSSHAQKSVLERLFPEIAKEVEG